MMSDEDVIAEKVREFVATSLPLGIYDPIQPRRSRVSVRSFDLEFLEFDEQLVHAAGPVVLEGPTGPVHCHLRISVPFEGEGAFEVSATKAAYIVEADTETGACKETAAMANA